MVSYIFYLYGHICTSFPWEVIVSAISLTIYVMTADLHDVNKSSNRHPDLCCQQNHSVSDIMVMTIIKCLAVLYSYYQFRNLQTLGSKYVLGITGLFVIFSSFIFITTVLNFLQIDLSDLQDAMFFFLLLIDLSKAARLAGFALISSDKVEIKSNIAKGLSVLGPKITLDTAVETLVIGIGTFSGVPRLEILCYFACLSVIVNYMVFMTFYPSSLFLLLELSKNTSMRHNDTLHLETFPENNEKTNPIVERVKIIMTICLLLIHLVVRQSFQNNSSLHFATDKASISNYVMQGYPSDWLSFCIDHVLVLLLLIALVIKALFLDKGDKGLRLNDIKCSQKIIRSTNVGIQTYESKNSHNVKHSVKTMSECFGGYNETELTCLTDEEIIEFILHKDISLHQLENVLKDSVRAVIIRRKLLCRDEKYKDIIGLLPMDNLDYDKVFGTCCENVIGYIPVPLGITGPIIVDNCIYRIPMATTEGCLIASITRGCKATSVNGITSKIISDGMTRGPVVRFPTASRAVDGYEWLYKLNNFEELKEKFDSTSRYAQLTKLKACVAGRYLFIRFVATTGDAMGMNMLSKGTQESLKCMQQHFRDMEILSLSGNFCSDKKAAYINWVEGRGKSVVCEAIIPSEIIKSLLKTTAQSIVEVNISKNLIGASMAGSIGGNNAHAANVVTAIFIATGQDPAQNLVSSNCITLVELWGLNNQDLYISCTMPSLEVGTVGGGTILPAQSACLDIMGVKGSNTERPGENGKQLARIICAAVLAGELSLLAALSADHLVESHLKHNHQKTHVR